jgi:oxygen-dependent protoporphyrinogen oxidase
MSVDSTDVAIIGGGISGLTTAFDLTRAGVRALVIEARPRVGGLIHTEHENGFVLEAGPDAMLVQKPAAIALCRELGLEEELVPTLEPRTAFVLRDGAFHPIPSETVLGLPLSQAALAACTMLSGDGRAAVARDFTAPAPPLSGADDESVASFVRRRLGDEAVRFIAQPLLGGIHAGDVERLSLRALFPMLADADARGGSLLEALRPRREGPTPGGAFRGLRRGMSTLTTRLAASIAAGPLGAGALSLGSDVVSIQPGSTFTLATSNGSLRARHLVFAIPAWRIADLVGTFDADLAQACTAIPYASTATISLAYRREDVAGKLAGTGFVVPRGESSTRLLAASWVTSKWPDRAPENTVLLRAFAGGVLDADQLELDDAELVRQAHRDLAPLLGLGAEPHLSRVYRWVRAGAQYEVGHSTRVAAIDAAAARWPGLWLTGSAFRGVGLPDCVADARELAARLVRALAV